MPEDAVLGVRAPLTGYASLKQDILHDFQSILYEVVGGKLHRFYHTATLQRANFITRLFTRYIDELNLLSAIRALSYFISSQSQTAKFRIEKDPRRS